MYSYFSVVKAYLYCQYASAVEKDISGTLLAAPTLNLFKREIPKPGYAF